MSKQLVVSIAAKEVGTKESPKDSNKTKYGKWFGLDGVMWCAIFVSWVYDKAGIKLPAVGFAKGFASCQLGFAAFSKKKWNTTDPQAGDLVFFDWNTDGRFDHVGIFVRWLDDRNTFETIEGNTSLTNNSNGGEVMVRTRRNNATAKFISPK